MSHRNVSHYEMIVLLSQIYTCVDVSDKIGMQNCVYFYNTDNRTSYTDPY